jgi:hypothetical protein
MQILVFNKITKPIYETGATIDLSPKAAWQPRVMRTDGTFRYPFGEHWIPNHILNQFVDGFLSNPVSSGTGGKGAFFSQYQGNNVTSLSFGSLFTPVPGEWDLHMQVGTGTGAAAQSNTALTSPATSTTVVAGNAVSMSPTNGNLVYTITRRFAAAGGGGATWTEGGLWRVLKTGASIGGPLGASFPTEGGGAWANGARLQSRVLFPSPIVLAAGEVLDLVCAVTVPTLAVNGLPVSLAAQNGMNISGVLKIVGTTAAIAGGTINNTTGVLTANTQYPIISDWAASRAGLSSLTSHAAYNNASSALSGNDVQGSWQAYSSGTRRRDMVFTWGSGTPASDTSFRSITIYRNSTGSNNTSGYQLLLDNEMTKLSTGTLAVTFRWQL